MNGDHFRVWALPYAKKNRANLWWFLLPSRHPSTVTAPSTAVETWSGFVNSLDDLTMAIIYFCPRRSL
jgi:hypothetical protein